MSMATIMLFSSANECMSLCEGITKSNTLNIHSNTHLFCKHLFSRGLEF